MNEASNKNLLENESCEVDDLTHKHTSNTPLAEDFTANVNIKFDQLESTVNPCLVESEEVPANALLNISLKKDGDEDVLSPSDFQDQPLEETEFLELEEMEAEKPSAVCRYRWTKAMDVNSDDIGFYPSYSPDTPVLLSWNDKAMAYFSNELRIPAGDYVGNLIVNGRVYATEEFSVRSYTFEVDLFMKDDEMMSTGYEQKTSVHEKDMGPVYTSDSLEFYSKSSQDLENVNSEAAMEDKSLVNHYEAGDGISTHDILKDYQDKPLSSSVKSDDISLNSLKRDSPVGNDGAGTFSEFNFDRKNNDGHIQEQQGSQEQRMFNEASLKSSSKVLEQPVAAADFLEDLVKPSSALYSNTISSTGTRFETETGSKNSRPPSLGADSANGFRHNVLKHSLSMDSIYGRPESKTSERFSPDNLRKTDTNTPRYQHTSPTDPDRFRTTESPVSSIQTALLKDRSSPALISTQESSGATPQRETIGDNIYEHRRKRAESGEPLSSGSPVSGRPPSHPSSRYGSQYPSRAQSLNSVVSDQELAQLFEHSGPSSASSMHPRSGALDPCNGREAERFTSASNFATQSQLLSPRSSLSNEREKLRDIHGRSPDTIRISSHAGSRTVTPVSFDNLKKEVSSDRIQDMEASLQNLKNQLASREAEIYFLTSQLEDLKEINRSLREDSNHRSRKYTPAFSVEDSFEYKQLLSEKEILASEVVSLRDEVQRLKRGQTGIRHGTTVSAITDYSPNSPTVLQRKIADLEAHIQDLHEVTEATNSSLMRAEEKMKVVQEENKDLKSRPHNNKSDLQAELRTLREDIKNLNDRNQQLREENLWLKENQKETSRTSSKEEPKYKSASLEPRHHFSVDQRPAYSNGEHNHDNLRSDDASVRPTSGYTSTSAYKYGTSSFTHGVSDRSRVIPSSPVSSKKISYEDQEPREAKHMNQAYDLDQGQESQLYQYKVRSDSSHQRGDSSHYRSDSSYQRGDSSYQRGDSSYHRGDSSQHRSDPSQHRSDPSYHKNDPSYQRSDSSYHRGDSSLLRNDPSHERSNTSNNRYQPRSDSSTRSKSTESSRAGLQYSDRSKPDGEVSEKIYTDKYMTLPYDRQSLGDSKERRSYLDKHSSFVSHVPRESADIWSQDKYNFDRKEDKYGYSHDGMQDRDARVKSLDRLSSPRGAISSRDIYLNLQQKRASKWLQQEERKDKLPSLHDDNDSDSTLVLMAGFTTDPTAEADILNQQTSKIKGNEKELAHDGLTVNSLFTHDNKYISGNLGLRLHQPSRIYVDNTGDDSDTATDILLAQNITSKGLVRRRKPSNGSEGSPSSLSDLEDHTDTLLKRRSKSVDAKRGQTRQVSARHRSDSASRTATSSEHMSVGFRSVVPPPLVTQHNKGEIVGKHSSLLSSSLTQGLRPFAPRSPADIRADDVVKFSSLGGKLTQGVVKYVGHLPGRSETYLGVELDKDEGKHDGTFEGVRYFKCKPSKGVFVSFNKVVMAWAP